MLKKVVAVAAATGGLVLAGAGMAAADSGAQGAAVHSRASCPATSCRCRFTFP